MASETEKVKIYSTTVCLTLEKRQPAAESRVCVVSIYLDRFTDKRYIIKITAMLYARSFTFPSEKCFPIG